MYLRLPDCLQTPSHSGKVMLPAAPFLSPEVAQVVFEHLHKADLLAGLQGARPPLSDPHYCLRATAGPLEDQEAGDGQPAQARQG